MIRAASLFVLALCLPLTAAEPAEKIRFVKTELDAKFRSEGAAVADLNGDGEKDIVAGMVWYEAPKWKMHSLVEDVPEYDPKGYSNAFCTFADDLSGDGRPDVIVVDFPGTPTWCFENPGSDFDKPWKKHTLTPVTNNESPLFLDLTGDGRRELIAAVSPDEKQPDGPDRRMAFLMPAKDPYQPWQIQAVSEKAAPSTQKYSHGLGSGDVNGDGRSDLLVADGWWEAPPGYATEKPWTFHQAPFGGKAAQMHVQDFDGDGDGDVLASSPHAFGIWWFEQVEGEWKQHTIDDSFSQTHSVCVADINGDGLDDFVTGKRWWAHGGSDPGGDQPAVIFWFELTRESGGPEWIRHQFDHDSGIGTQFEIADVDGDGLLDVVTSNKKGVHYFRQVRD